MTGIMSSKVAGDDHLEGRDGYNTYSLKKAVINSSVGMDLSALGADSVIDLTAKTIIVDSGLPEVLTTELTLTVLAVSVSSGNDEFISLTGRRWILPVVEVTIP